MHLSAIKRPLPGDLAPPLGPRVSHFSRVPGSSAVRVPQTSLPHSPSLSLLRISHIFTPMLIAHFVRKWGLFRTADKLQECDLGVTQAPDASSASAPRLLYGSARVSRPHHFLRRCRTGQRSQSSLPRWPVLQSPGGLKLTMQAHSPQPKSTTAERLGVRHSLHFNTCPGASGPLGAEDHRPGRSKLCLSPGCACGLSLDVLELLLRVDFPGRE